MMNDNHLPSLINLWDYEIDPVFSVKESFSFSNDSFKKICKKILDSTPTSSFHSKYLLVSPSFYFKNINIELDSKEQDDLVIALVNSMEMPQGSYCRVFGKDIPLTIKFDFSNINSQNEIFSLLNSDLFNFSSNKISSSDQKNVFFKECEEYVPKKFIKESLDNCQLYPLILRILKFKNYNIFVRCLIGENDDKQLVGIYSYEGFDSNYKRSHLIQLYREEFADHFKIYHEGLYESAVRTGLLEDVSNNYKKKEEG